MFPVRTDWAVIVLGQVAEGLSGAGRACPFSQLAGVLGVAAGLHVRGLAEQVAGAGDAVQLECLAEDDRLGPAR